MKNKKQMVPVRNSVISSMIWNGMASCLSFIITMFITSLVTNDVGAEAVGYITLANNFINYVTIFTSALNSYATRYISLEYHKEDKNKTSVYFNSVLFSNLVGGLGILVVAFGITFWLDHILVIPNNLVNDVKLLFLLMFLNFFFMLLGNTFFVSAYIKDRLDLSGVCKSIGYIVEIIILAFVYAVYIPRVWYVGMGYAVFSAIVLFGGYYLYRKLIPDIKIDRKKFSFHAVKELTLAGVWNSINSLGNTLNSGLDLLITNRMLSPLIMGQLSIAKTIGSLVCVLYQLVSQAFQPKLLKAYAFGDKEKLFDVFEIAMKASGFISGTAFVGFVVLGKEFYGLWIPNQNIDYIYNLTVITLLSYALEGVVGPLYYIYTLTIKNKVPCIITVCGGILNVVSMYLLLTYTNLGGYAVVGTTTIIMIFINLVTNPLYMARCMKVKWNKFYPTIFRYVGFILVSVSVNSIIFGNTTIFSWPVFVLYGIMVCCICMIMYYIIVLNRKQKGQLKAKFLIKKNTN